VRIVLVGFMGSGKTVVGRALAGELGIVFFDIDEVLSERFGGPVEEIIVRRGLEAFREMEIRVVREAAALEMAVIATGGGSLLSGENRALLRAGGVWVYLRTKPETLVRRSQGKGYSRPIFLGPDPVMNVHRLLLEREPQYLGADLILSTDARSVEEIVLEIRRFLPLVRKAKG
jgi:shikimate kinase